MGDVGGCMWRFVVWVEVHVLRFEMLCKGEDEWVMWEALEVAV